MCTTLGLADTDGNVYHGRTLELDVEDVYAVTYVPVGTPFTSNAAGSEPLKYDAKYAFIAIGAPDRAPTADDPLGPSDVKVIEGMNTAGVSFSLLAYPTKAGAEEAKATTKAMVDAVDLGSWALANFANVDEVKQGIADHGISLTLLPFVGNLPFPFHFIARDKTGKALVIEFLEGELTLHDNPVGVMTNGPKFEWHLTNLDNFTHLNNVDVSKNKFGNLEVSQPDSGIATATIPSSNTSVGRFIKALYYSNFTEKGESTEMALYNLARVMDNFDRPRGVTTDPGESGGLPGTQMVKDAVSTEYTSWTNLSDLAHGTFMVRAYQAFNYTSFDLNELSKKNEIHLALLSSLKPLGGDGTDAMFPLPAKS
ncbi:MAG TPA: linear amide C-N hydrolase [Gordonia sp. (in: high G+C Gram-positive bacteria)]|uniref:linear amide C-N hydrolase n=1 Tax=unclassified Gordonia (in: high G+C Gram-positive bacteria) TaxID=2657482 RepID=UPI000FBC4AC9|nr:MULTISPECIES: linear amide C-N hydrolase [unclassified Gordonia (in: high G+C Gram-positive bacteria)]RUP40151.1 MAG: linear amide C-N hydrolase [Gordonia sp. (in: high G+C Gram-positive bacteria)]HNP55886.1 linear amide C-N hydrolase [Gordonia sp. (in: high G+C Gram-positive bacteria)]HRC52129.1 linear amide C-N hydrolase [Gordonia sp. (in: high G+C Gram-positive bacteria)]